MKSRIFPLFKIMLITALLTISCFQKCSASNKDNDTIKKLLIINNHSNKIHSIFEGERIKCWILNSNYRDTVVLKGKMQIIDTNSFRVKNSVVHLDSLIVLKRIEIGYAILSIPIMLGGGFVFGWDMYAYHDIRTNPNWFFSVKDAKFIAVLGIINGSVILAPGVSLLKTHVKKYKSEKFSFKIKEEIKR